MGSVWLVVGLGVLEGVSDPPAGALHGRMSDVVQGTLWVSSGAVACVSAFLHRDRWAFALLIAMPLLRVVSYAFLWVWYLLPGGQPGDPDAWYSIAFHGAMVAWVLITAGWPEPVRAGREL